MTPRKYIIRPNSLTHVYFRCHNKSYFLQPYTIKKKLLILLAKYKNRYNVRIHEFCIMDNHCHLLITAPDAEQLGCFMRTVGSQLATAINKHFDRDSQALRERYKSPIVVGARYINNVIKYIYLNRFRVNKLRPDKDYFCSAFWRIFKPHKFTLNTKTSDEKKSNLLSKLLDDYNLHDMPSDFGSPRATKRIVNEALNNEKNEVGDGFYDNGHTIGDSVTVKYRTQLISAFFRERGPPNFS